MIQITTSRRITTTTRTSVRSNETTRITRNGLNNIILTLTRRKRIRNNKNLINRRSRNTRPIIRRLTRLASNNTRDNSVLQSKRNRGLVLRQNNVRRLLTRRTLSNMSNQVNQIKNGNQLQDLHVTNLNSRRSITLGKIFRQNNMTTMIQIALNDDLYVTTIRNSITLNRSTLILQKRVTYCGDLIYNHFNKELDNGHARTRKHRNKRSRNNNSNLATGFHVRGLRKSCPPSSKTYSTHSTLCAGQEGKLLRRH